MSAKWVWVDFLCDTWEKAWEKNTMEGKIVKVEVCGDQRKKIFEYKNDTDGTGAFLWTTVSEVFELNLPDIDEPDAVYIRGYFYQVKLKGGRTVRLSKEKCGVGMDEFIQRWRSNI